MALDGIRSGATVKSRSNGSRMSRRVIVRATGRWTGPKTAVLSMAPVMRCVPHSSTPVRFSDPDIKLGDMNRSGRRLACWPEST